MGSGLLYSVPSLQKWPSLDRANSLLGLTLGSQEFHAQTGLNPDTYGSMNMGDFMDTVIQNIQAEQAKNTPEPQQQGYPNTGMAGSNAQSTALPSPEVPLQVPRVSSIGTPNLLSPATSLLSARQLQQQMPLEHIPGPHQQAPAHTNYHAQIPSLEGMAHPAAAPPGPLPVHSNVQDTMKVVRMPRDAC